MRFGRVMKRGYREMKRFRQEKRGRVVRYSRWEDAGFGDGTLLRRVFSRVDNYDQYRKGKMWSIGWPTW